MGLPYFSAVWVWNYYADMLEKLKIDKPFTTYDEFIEHCVKAKKDGVSRYPDPVGRGRRPRAAAGHLVPDDLEPRRHLLRQAGQPQLGAGSIARETLKWWANTFEKGLDIADPESLKVQFTTSAKAFGAGKNLYRGPNHHYGLNVVNDPAQSPIAGKVKVLGSPGDGKTIGVTHVYFLSTANRDKEWALEAAAVSRRQDQGRQLHAGRQPRQGRHAGLGLQLGDEQRRGQAGLGAVGRRAGDPRRSGTRRPTSARSARRSTSPGTSRGPTSSTSRSRSA